MRILSLSLSSNSFVLIPPLTCHAPLNLSPRTPRPPQFNLRTPPILYSPLGLMPEQHVAGGAQTVMPDIVRVGGRYRVGKLLGAGTFGTSI